MQVDLGRSEDYSLHYLTVEAMGDNEVEVTVVEDVVGPLDTLDTQPSVIKLIFFGCFIVFIENCSPPINLFFTPGPSLGKGIKKIKN